MVIERRKRKKLNFNIYSTNGATKKGKKLERKVYEWQKEKWTRNDQDDNNSERDRGGRSEEELIEEESRTPLKYGDVEVTPDEEAILKLVPGLDRKSVV